MIYIYIVVINWSAIALLADKGPAAGTQGPGTWGDLGPGETRDLGVWDPGTQDLGTLEPGPGTWGTGNQECCRTGLQEIMQRILSQPSQLTKGSLVN